MTAGITMPRFLDVAPPSVIVPKRARQAWIQWSRTTPFLSRTHRARSRRTRAPGAMPSPPAARAVLAAPRRWQGG